MCEECIEEMRENKRMKYTKEDNIKFCNAKSCHICDQKSTSKSVKVRDHDHRTGDFRGAAHDKCNINYYTNIYLPVVAHNLRGYDSHFIIRKAHQNNDTLGNKNINVIQKFV